MPVIVVGADTPIGSSIIDGLFDTQREIRAFVSDMDEATRLKERGVKVALGDVSDESHVEAAATRCFTAVLIAEAANDHRERSFATEPSVVLEGWARAVSNAHVTRVIWVAGGEPPPTTARDVAQVSPEDDELVERVVALDEAQTIS